jgi:hypothetical protein
MRRAVAVAQVRVTDDVAERALLGAVITRDDDRDRVGTELLGLAALRTALGEAQGDLVGAAAERQRDRVVRGLVAAAAAEVLGLDGADLGRSSAVDRVYRLSNTYSAPELISRSS